MPTAEQQQQKNKPVEPRFKIDHAASPMPETRQPERLAPRATSNRNGGRDHLGILGEIKSVHPGEIIGIGTPAPACKYPGANRPQTHKTKWVPSQLWQKKIIELKNKIPTLYNAISGAVCGTAPDGYGRSLIGVGGEGLGGLPLVSFAGGPSG
jgi:hypothetical protein